MIEAVQVMFHGSRRGGEREAALWADIAVNVTTRGGGEVMSLWQRFKRWREARNAERQALQPGRGRIHTGDVYSGAAMLASHDVSMAASGGDTAPGTADCGPAVSSDCGGSGL
jgi:hypothetical protein